MIWIHLLVVLAAIFLGARLGGIAIGFSGGLGVLALFAAAYYVVIRIGFVWSAKQFLRRF